MLKQFDVPVRCSKGHLFTTIWMPLGSLKAMRLGRKRWQYCPVGHHFATVERLYPNSSSEEELKQAAEVHDLRIP
jgi:hypothetical protein